MKSVLKHLLCCSQVIMLGDSGVGKTSFLVHYQTGEFKAGSFSATVGVALTVSDRYLISNDIFLW